MNCPRDGAELRGEELRGIQVDRCPQCNGRWLDHDELGQLEATDESTEEQRVATIEYANRESELDCPKCGTRMTSFNYRASSLELEACEQTHGYWLDAGEEGRVRDIIQDRVRGLERSASAEASWDKFLDGMRRGSFFDRFRGR